MIPSGHTGSHPTTRPSIIFRRGMFRRAPVINYIPNPVISINYSQTRAPQHHSPHYEDRAPPMQPQSYAYSAPGSDAMPGIHVHHYDGSFPDSVRSSPENPPAAWPPAVDPVSNLLEGTSSQLEQWEDERYARPRQSRSQATNYEQDEDVRDDSYDSPNHEQDEDVSDDSSDGSGHYRPSTRRQAHRGVHIYEQYDDDDDDEEEKAPDSSPNLASKILSRVASNSSIVTDMKIEPAISASTCITILSRSPNLCKLEITLGLIISKEERPLERLEHLTHNLSTLVLVTSIHPKPLFGWLILPRLARLSIDARTGHYERNSVDEEDRAIYDLLTRSACALEKLKLVDVYPSTEDLDSCLRSRACVTLQKLVVRSTLLPSTTTSYLRENVAVEILWALTNTVSFWNWDGNSPLFCRHLKSAELSYCAGDAREFVNMVKARIERGPFSIKFLHWDRDVSREIMRQLAELARTAPHPLQFEESQAHVINSLGRRDTICNYQDSGVDMGRDT